MTKRPIPDHPLWHRAQGQWHGTFPTVSDSGIGRMDLVIAPHVSLCITTHLPDRTRKDFFHADTLMPLGQHTLYFGCGHTYFEVGRIEDGIMTLSMIDNSSHTPKRLWTRTLEFVTNGQ